MPIVGDNIPNDSGIYQIICTSNNGVYVGSAQNLRKRKNIHVSNLRNNKHHSPYLQNSWNKYGEEAFEFQILEYCDPSQCELVEDQYLNIIFNPEYFDQKLRFNTSKNAHAPMLGRKHSQETIEKQKSSGGKRLGLKLPKDLAKNISDKRNSTFQERYGGDPNRKAVLQLDPITKEVVAQFESIKEAQLVTGISKDTISVICNNVPQKRMTPKGLYQYFRKTAGGYDWKFLEEEN